MKALPWIGLAVALMVLGLVFFHPSGYRVKAIQAGLYADSLQAQLDSSRADVSRIHEQNLDLNAKAADAELALQDALDNRKPLRQAIDDALEVFHSTDDLDSLRAVLVQRPD